MSSGIKIGSRNKIYIDDCVEVGRGNGINEYYMRRTTISQYCIREAKYNKVIALDDHP